MLFPTITFAIFFTIVITGHWLLLDRARPWRVFMLVASYVFYAWFDPRFVLLLQVSTILDYLVARAMVRTKEQRRRKALLVASIAGNLALLGVFKYLDFFLRESVNALQRLGVHTTVRPLGLIVPIGISFFVFKTLSYTIDVYRGELEPTKSLLEYALFVSFWPELVAGPIVRGSVFFPQLRSERREPIEPARAYLLILGGLFKKMVIADLLAVRVVDTVFGSPAGHSGPRTLIAIYAYAVQIFCDFSGYSDIATGCAQLLGFRFPKNFDRPYAAASLQEFWRRWHITLSTWLRDYLYIPLGGSKGGRLKTARNIAVTMVLGGLWHGAGWTFVVWGTLHGGGLAVERELRARIRPRVRSLAAARWVRAAKIVVTFHLVCLGWVFFRARSIGAAATVLSNLGHGWNAYPAVGPAVLLALAFGLLVHLVPGSRVRPVYESLGRLSPVAQGALCAVALMGIASLGAPGVAPFIYFQF
jgi:D-alanyl-lipoteichoic acid acyltransferase DltB (MBOAT superfamily)